MQFRSLEGYIPYEQACTLQQELLERRIRDEIEDTILFLEHTPVITRGRGLQFTGEPGRPRQMPLPQKLPHGVEFSESERGGDLTYHGPGQLVIYPICKLDGSGFGPARDMGGFLRKLEKVCSGFLKNYGLHACVRAGATGVWIGNRKIASIGIAVRKWVTYHGVAINIVNDLEPFRGFSPCGFAPEVMTRLKDCVADGSVSEKITEQGWRAQAEEELKREFVGMIQ